MDLQVFPPILWVFFSFSNSVLWCTSFKILIKSNYLFSFFAYVFGVISEKSLPNPISWRLFLMFCSNSFIVLLLKLRSLINLSYFCKWHKGPTSFFLAYKYCLHSNIYWRLSFPHWMVFILLLKSGHMCEGLFLCYLLCVCPYALPHCFHYCSFVVYLEASKCESCFFVLITLGSLSS